MQEMLKQFALLGSEWILWLLVILSVISIAIMVERAIRVAMARSTLDEIFALISGFLGKKDWDGAAKALEKNKGSVATEVKEGLANAKQGTQVAEEVMTAQITAQRQNLMRLLPFLGSVGSNAPFVGLLGTVLGIIRAFHDLAFKGNEGPSVVMAGISEALVATAIGLLVAIPAVAAFNYFRVLVDRNIEDCERASKLLLAYMGSKEE